MADTNPTPIDAWLAEQEAEHGLLRPVWSPDEDYCISCGIPAPCPDLAKLAVIAAAAKQHHACDWGVVHRFGDDLGSRHCTLCAALTALTTDGGAHGESR